MKRRYATKAVARQDTPGFARLRRQMTALEELWRTVPHIEMSHLCPLVIDRAVSALEAHTGSLFLRDRGTDTMRLSASVGLSSEVNQSMTIIIGEGIAGRVAESRQPVLIHKDPDAHPLMQGRKSRIKRRTEIESAICVPLLAVNDGTVLGVLSVSRRVPSQQFIDDDMRVLSLFASIVGATFGQTMVLDDVRRMADEQVQMQRQMARSEQLAGIGRLAATVAHEVRNPLGAIKGSAQHLMSVTRDRADCQEFLGIVIEEADGLAQVTTDLLDFSKSDPVQQEAFDIVAVLSDEVSLLLKDPAFRNKVKSSVSGLSSQGVVSDKLRIVRAVRNVLRNAAQAACLACVHHGEPQVDINISNIDDAVVVAIGDNGPGIPIELREKIFEPFYTTRSRGTGLGLAQVRQDLDLLGIRMDVGISQYSGAEITLIFPCADAETN
ncbi:MAG: ATP-binding protein [Armatimonadota bacterium]